MTHGWLAAQVVRQTIGSRYGLVGGSDCAADGANRAAGWRAFIPTAAVEEPREQPREQSAATEQLGGGDSIAAMEQVARELAKVPEDRSAVICGSSQKPVAIISSDDNGGGGSGHEASNGSQCHGPSAAELRRDAMVQSGTTASFVKASQQLVPDNVQGLFMPQPSCGSRQQAAASASGVAGVSCTGRADQEEADHATAAKTDTIGISTKRKSWADIIADKLADKRLVATSAAGPPRAPPSAGAATGQACGARKRHRSSMVSRGGGRER